MLVSSPLMPPVCDLCKEIGHISKRCPKIPKTCAYCKSPDHALPHCPKKVRQEGQGKKTRRGRSKDKRTEAGVSYNSILPRSATPKIRSSLEFRSLWLVEVSSSGSQQTPLPTKPLLQVLYRWRLLRNPSSEQQLRG